MKHTTCRACRALATGALKSAVQPGKKGIDRRDDPLFQVRVDCSANVEKALERGPGEKSFDYPLIVGEACQTRLAEIHPASSTGAVQELVDKKRGTESALARMKVPLPGATWHWLVPGQGRIAFKATDAYGKRLAAARITQPRRSMVD